MVIVLCECNGGVDGIKKLPPHFHAMAGLVQMPSGEKRWLNGAITPEQREFIQIDHVRFTKDDLVAFVASIRGGPEGQEGVRRDAAD